MREILEKFQREHPTKEDKEKALKTMTNEQIDELIEACGTVQGKIFYSKYRK